MLLAGLGSALGGMGRYLVMVLVPPSGDQGFPWATLIVNVAGSALIGAMAECAALERGFLHTPGARQFFMVGLLGGFTTFSSFSLQALQMMQAGRWPAVGAYVASSLLLCLAGAAAGAWTVSRVLGRHDFA